MDSGTMDPEQVVLKIDRVSSEPRRDVLKWMCRRDKEEKKGGKGVLRLV